MSRHPTDHEQPTAEAGLKHVMPILRDRAPSFWQVLWKRGALPGPVNRRVVEFVRIARGRSV